MTNQNPKGGTELQLEFLTKYVKKELLDQVQICTSVPGKVPIDPNKINKLWLKQLLEEQLFICLLNYHKFIKNLDLDSLIPRKVIYFLLD